MRTAGRTALFLSCLLALPSATAAEDKKVSILGLVDASAPLTVDYRTEGRRVRDTILATGLLGIFIASGEQSKESKAFQAVIGEFDRRRLIEGALAAGFAAPSPYFQVAIPDHSGNFLSKKGKVDLDAVKSSGHKFALVVHEDMAGLITAWTMAHLSATSFLSYELYDVEKGKLMAKGSTTGFARPEYEFEAATSDRTRFVTDYPLAMGSAVGTIYGQLYKDNHLNTMAQSVGLGDKVLPIGKVLDRYAGQFSYKFALPKGWEQVKTSSTYTTLLQPKNEDKMRIGINFTLDLLIEEFGQDVADVEEYAALYLGKLAKAGYKLAPEADSKPFDVPAFRSYAYGRLDGNGKEVVLFRKLSDNFVAIYTVVLASDLDALLGKYRKDVEGIINNASIQTKS
jgi:hypothetical protein